MHTSLSGRIAGTLAEQQRTQTLALFEAAPKIRAAEHLERILRKYGIEAAAEGHVIGSIVSTHVLALGGERKVAKALALAGISFDRCQVRGQDAVHFDCCLGTYTVTVLCLPPEHAESQS